MKLNKNYNQYTDYYTRNACSLVTILNIMKYNYWIFVVPSFIIKFAIFFAKAEKWFPKFWAMFNVVYPFAVRQINKKLDLNFKLVITNVYKLKPTDKLLYSLWVKKYSSHKWGKAWADWNISLIDMDNLVEYTWWVYHNLWYTAKMWGRLVDTNWLDPYELSLEALKKGVNGGVFWSTLRTIVPADEETKEVIKLTKKMAKAEYNWKLWLLYNKEINNPYLKKAKKLYFYGR